MLHLLDLFRIYYGGRPLLLTLALFAAIVATVRIVRVLGDDARWARVATVAIAIAGVLGLFAYPSIAIWYASEPHFFDNAEPTILCVAWVYRMGGELYHALDAAERYSHIYGPMAFIVHGIAFAVLGPSIGVSKWLGAIAGLSSLGVLYATVRRSCPTARALVLTGCAALLLLLFRNFSFWSRPDSLQLLCSALALYAAGGRRPLLSAAVVALASGVLWNLKFTGPVYSLPVLVIVWQRFGIRTVSLTVAGALLVAAVPFALANVSLHHYLEWIRLSGSTGLLLLLLRQNLEWALYLCLPLLLADYLIDRRASQDTGDRRVVQALAVGVSLVIIAASKPGAGPYHFIPFVPTIIYAVARRVQDAPVSILGSVAPAGVLAYVTVLIVIVTAQTAQFMTVLAPRRESRELDDIRGFMATHAGVIEMGYGRTEALSLARPVLTFRNNSYLIDQPAVREYQLQGLSLPSATIDAMRQCRINYWLIPKGEEPFSGVNAYTAVLGQSLYPQSLRHTFVTTHRLIESTEYYDVWQCVSQPSQPNFTAIRPN